MEQPDPLLPDPSFEGAPGLEPGPDPDEREEVGGRRSPLRRCVATMAVAPKDGMIRFVVGPDGRLLPDLDEKLPGRGYWVTADKDALELAVKKRAFARAARRPVEVAPDLRGVVAEGLRRRCMDILGLARRAGQVVAGFEQVREALIGGKVAFRVEASDGAAEGRSKLTAIRRDLPMVTSFSAGELAAALGRAHVVHVAIAEGGFAVRFARELTRLEGVLAGASRPQGTGTESGV
ncbi:MAG TPA: RNA-binding protein [Azospirillaceae bacterium]|nr:RNA-binding protein [Azospirillaceae bacterium]